jgi:multiple sugar transport system permease protein
MSARRGNLLSTIGLYALACVLALWVVLPIYLITLGAFSTQDAIYSYPLQLWPHHVTGSTLGYFIHSAGVIPSLERSVWVMLVTLALALGIGVPAGYALARFRFPGANLLRLGVVGTRAFPIVIIAIPLAATFIRWGIDDSILGVAIVHTALALPFAILTTSSIFSGISVEIEEAAMTLGCSRATAFLRVILPLALPGLAASAIFVIVLSWNEVFAASTLTLLHRTLPAQVVAVLDQALLPYRFAGGFFLLAPPLVMIFVIRRFLFGMWGTVIK